MIRRLTPLILATFVSELGSALTIAALPLIFLTAGRKDGIAIYNGLDALGALIGAIWVMGFIDRFRRNRVAVISDLIRAATLAPLLFLKEATLPSLLSYAIAQAIFGAATSSAIQAWVAEHPMTPEELRKANSGLELAGQAGRAIAPLLGVAILATSSVKVIFAVDAATYIFGAILMLGLKSRVPKVSDASVLAEIREGFRASLANPSIRRWIFISGAQFFALAAMNTVYLTILADRIGANAKQLTFFQSAYFIGAIAGGFFGTLSKRSVLSSLRWSSLILGVVMVSAIFVHGYWTFFALAIIQRAVTLIAAVCTRTLCQADAPSEALGRVMAFRSAAIDIFGIGSYAVCVLVFGFVAVPTLLLAATAACLIATALAWPVPPVTQPAQAAL